MTAWLALCGALAASSRGANAKPAVAGRRVAANLVERRVAANLVERRVAANLVERRVAVMGTSLDLSIVAARRDDGLAASELVVEEVRRVEDLLTTWRQSPLERLNRAPVGEDVRIGEEIAAVLQRALRWSGRTGGAFDPTVAPLMRAWDLRGAGRIPTPAELAAAVAATGPSRFRVDDARGTAARFDPEAGIDEGAWGKGYALDRAAAKLAGAGVALAGALIDLGGQVLALGEDGSGAAWRIGVAHPRDRGREVLAIALSQESASTSGNSERGRTVAGRRIGHELDPHSGEPAPDFGSVTVVAPSAFDADVLSTAFFVLGPERGLALSESLRRDGVAQEVLFLIDRGEHLEALSSPGLSNRIVWADTSIVDPRAHATPSTP